MCSSSTAVDAPRTPTIDHQKEIMPTTPRTPGIDLQKEIAHQLFDSHIPLATCKPHELWKLAKVAKNGLTSSWSTIDKHYNIVSEFLDAGKGHIVKHKKLHEYFVEWLAMHKMTWAFKHSEQSIIWLRCMLQSIQCLKRDGGRSAQKP